MKLYSYDHCPYCVKARMIFGIKNIPLEVENLLNDDEETPISLIGQKMCPILVKPDGSYMPESMDIVAYCDELTEFGNKMVQPTKNDHELLKWLAEVRQYHYPLAMPRWVKMGLPEFATQEAVQYFTVKKEKSIGPFEEILKKSAQLIELGNEHLKELEQIIVGAPYFWGEQLTEDDFHVFASLRVLTTTQGIQFPDKINSYMNFMSEKSNVPLHWDKAIGGEA